MTTQEILNEKECIWIDYSPRHGDYLVDAYLKGEGGIQHLVHRYHQISLAVIRSDLAQYGYFSQRPFELGRGCDGSGDACCHALYFRFCLVSELDPMKLYRQAYQEHDRESYQDPDYPAILRQANWEGVNYPEHWGIEEFEGLISSLYAINNRSLVAVLEALPISSRLDNLKELYQA